MGIKTIRIEVSQDPATRVWSAVANDLFRREGESREAAIANAKESVLCSMGSMLIEGHGLVDVDGVVFEVTGDTYDDALRHVRQHCGEGRMKAISIHLAEPIADRPECDPEPVIIIVEAKIPHYEGPGWAAKHEKLHADDASSIALALRRSLPQATLHRLVVELLQAMPAMYVGADPSVPKV